MLLKVSSRVLSRKAFAGSSASALGLCMGIREDVEMEENREGEREKESEPLLV